MTVSIELFLLDNMMMNYLVLRLACIFCTSGARQLRLWLAAGFGAGYALLSVWKLPVLYAPALKLLLCLLMALPVAERMRAYPKALLCLLLSASLMGGVMFALLQFFGGEFYRGAYVCTVSLRMALLAICVCALLPRLVVSVLHAVRTRRLMIHICIRFPDRTIRLTALIDSGNLLTEPVSGLPVVIVRPGLLPNTQCTRPVAFRTVNGAGVLKAMRPSALYLYQSCWRRVDAFVAESGYALSSADAILPAALLSEEGRYEHAQLDEVAPAPFRENAPREDARDAVHSLGGNAAGAFSAAGGAGMDRQADAK